MSEPEPTAGRSGVLDDALARLERDDTIPPELHAAILEALVWAATLEDGPPPA